MFYNDNVNFVLLQGAKFCTYKPQLVMMKLPRSIVKFMTSNPSKAEGWIPTLTYPNVALWFAGDYQGCIDTVFDLDESGYANVSWDPACVKPDEHAELLVHFYLHSNKLIITGNHIQWLARTASYPMELNGWTLSQSGSHEQYTITKVI